MTSGVEKTQFADETDDKTRSSATQGVAVCRRGRNSHLRSVCVLTQLVLYVISYMDYLIDSTAALTGCYGCTRTCSS